MWSFAILRLQTHIPLQCHTGLVFPGHAKIQFKSSLSETIRLTMVNTAFRHSSLSTEESYETQHRVERRRRRTRSRTHSNSKRLQTNSLNWDINVQWTGSVCVSHQTENTPPVRHRNKPAAAGAARLNEMLEGAHISLSFSTPPLHYTHARTNTREERHWAVEVTQGKAGCMTSNNTLKFVNL